MFFQVDEDYGVDWAGAYNHRPSNDIIIPETELPRTLTDEQLTALPSPSVPLSQALAVYSHTVRTLKVVLGV